MYCFCCTQTLTAIDLSDNQMGAGGAASLAAALKKNRAVRRLDLRRNGLGREGALHLAGLLRVGACWLRLRALGCLPYSELL